MRNLFCITAVETGTKVASRTAAIAAACLACAACVSHDDATPSESALSAAERGFSIAEGSCAECHAISAGEPQSPNPAAPAFDALANRPDMTRTALAVLLRTPHRTMPNLIVESEKVDDLSAYLSTLRR